MKMSFTNDNDNGKSLGNTAEVDQKTHALLQEENTKGGMPILSSRCGVMESDFLKIRESGALSNSLANPRIKNKSFLLADTAQDEFNIGNNLALSPIGDNKSKILIQTPNNIPYIQFELKMDSPFQEKMLSSSGLRHSARSSNFKAYQLSNYESSISGRNINFEHCMNNEYEYPRDIPPREGHSQRKEKRGSHRVPTLNFSPDSHGCEYSQDAHNQMDIDEENAVRHIFTQKQEDCENRSYNAPNNPTRRLSCTCTKSGCLKKYCECFANKIFCSECECQNCYNQLRFKEMIKRSLNTQTTESKQNTRTEIICNCSKSNCMKKYCECFKAEKQCGDLCRCIHCENIQIENMSKKSIDDSSSSAYASEKKKKSKNPQNFIIEGTSVFIHNSNIMISTRKEVPKKYSCDSIVTAKNQDECQSNNDSMLPGISEESGNPSKIFETNRTEFEETPKICKKRKRVGTEAKCSSIVKSNSTHFQTPIFTTSEKKRQERKVSFGVNNFNNKFEI